ncbi:hypothetical protein F4821DRAFT_278486 [Hypoxylon rubiginosum]|uniref:Uncharacterized protein n=1 Tax=Hypoxylon rubiginosum TaxID=110542 RepID=A0ACC0D112_9PEZI|nr:hypothetical protein F4821DRAFT_278486 [Hypoxylon rubiginosum]
MTRERSPTYLKFQHIESGDSFPERHFSDLSDFTIDCDDSPGKQFPLKIRWVRKPPKNPSESPEGYEMRARYWEAADIMRSELKKSRKAPDVWDYVYDTVFLPPLGFSKTPTIRRLGYMPIRRAWKRRSAAEKPNLRQARIIEAIMIYERGMVLNTESRCHRCKEGKGVSPECVIEPGSGGNTCSNCRFDGMGSQCQVQDAPSKHSNGGNDNKSNESATKTTGSTKDDYVIVLKLIQQMKQKSCGGLAKGDDVSLRAKRIEEAALKIAQAAREWGLREGSA